jgi:hypothetical protein
MGFDPIKAASILGMGEKVSEQVGKHLDGHARRKQDSLDGEVRRSQEVLNGETDRAIRTSKQKVDNFSKYVGTIFNALETISNVYSNIGGTINESHKINAQIEKDRNQFELDKKVLENELENIRGKHENESQEIYNSHEEKMIELEQQYRKEMIVIESIQNNINRLFNSLEYMVKKDPSNPQIIAFIGQLNNTMLQLRSIDTTKYLEDE